MSNNLKFYIDGAWVDPIQAQPLDVINPATEEAYTQISLGQAADVEKAISAAKRAFVTYSRTSKADRLQLLKRVLEEYNARYDDIAQAITQEMGAPLSFSQGAQAYTGRAHLESAIEALENFIADEYRGSTMVTHEPIGVCALITPWNWPMNQVVTKVAPALAAGCTVVLKPSEIAPISSVIFAEVIHAAGVPAGVFNMVNGSGPDVGQVMAAHSDVDMVSFTGSTRAGIIVAKVAADTVKRVAQELGGKSANIILEDADFPTAVSKGVAACFANSGQSCDAPTRMLVPAARMEEALAIAREAAREVIMGDPLNATTTHGPVISKTQFDKIQSLIGSGIEEGATLVAGGLDRPDDLPRGYYVQPTIFGNVTPTMTIAREEIFGPVLSIIGYESETQAVEIANASVYGLAAYVQSSDQAHARAVALKLRAGSVYINYPDWDTRAPFGGYKQSGNGREYADFGLRDFLEIKGVVGWGS
ncbi:aldehyde dehydrogenase [Pseudomonas sp. RIT-PI-q]|uniref:aldehyde dehydrogenase family protein n=1 Tax=Pseudomonas sp. RIT-PI-q TaxID=1690247 RepID=UPI0006CC9935|nr:aldehyde dehydrogenase family protein [Pseudomonas sp. RIT-PI-q]KPG96028.1 aldehyde dehydrogenase [Pseudomonas sp. RIT-PI-q]